MSASDAWSEVLGAKYGTVEFARRHTQVVGLLDDTATAIAALPKSATDRLLPHLQAWWDSVVLPGGSWAAERTVARDVISDAELESLANAADLVEAHLEGSGFATHLVLRDIDEACVNWISLIPNADLPPEFEHALISQVEHLRWMISNAEIFGLSAIAREAHRTLGSVSLASKDVGNPSIVNSWKRGCTALAVAITSWTGAATLAHEGIDSTRVVVEDVAELVDDFRGDPDPPPNQSDQP